MKIFCATAFLVILIVASCSKESHTYVPVKGGCTEGIISYRNDIKPIIQTNCSGPTCHVAGTGNYDFSKYEVLANNIESGSFSHRLLLPTNSPQHMPQTGPPYPVGYNMSDSCDLYKILTWIDQGYPEN